MKRDSHYILDALKVLKATNMMEKMVYNHLFLLRVEVYEIDDFDHVREHLIREVFDDFDLCVKFVEKYTQHPMACYLQGKECINVLDAEQF